MMNGNSGASLSDIAALMNNGDGFGGNNGWWVLIILFAVFGGWGNGWGGNAGGSVTRTDMCSEFNFQNLLRDVADLRSDTIRQNNYSAQGFAGLNAAITNGGYETRNAVQQGQIANMQSFNALTSLINQCCCDNKSQIAQVKYDLAMQHQELLTAIKDMGQTIMLNDNNNYRQLHDENIALQMAQKDATISDLKDKLGQCSQDNQTNVLLAAIAELTKKSGCCN